MKRRPQVEPGQSRAFCSAGLIGQKQGGIWRKRKVAQRKCAQRTISPWDSWLPDLREAKSIAGCKTKSPSFIRRMRISRMITEMSFKTTRSFGRAINPQGTCPGAGYSITAGFLAPSYKATGASHLGNGLFGPSGLSRACHTSSCPPPVAHSLLSTPG